MKNNQANEILIKDYESLKQHIAETNSLACCTLQHIDLTSHSIDWSTLVFAKTTFLACKMSIEEEVLLRRKGATIFHTLDNLPYNPYRESLYTWQELMEGYEPGNDQSIDIQIYNHFSATRYNPNVREALCQRIHDHSIDDALRVLLGFNEKGLTDRKCVGFMGGHGILRGAPSFIRTAETAKLVAEAGYYVVSGGGPGIMEAANFGAYFAGKSKAEFDEALSIIQKAPHYTHPLYIEQARKVLRMHPEGGESLAIPTWFYGHEPSNLFASSIAKYFSNSIREDTLLAISLYGIIYAKGSAGTTQEIFMDAAQNHYGSYGYHSPMVFLGTKRYEIETMIYPLLRQLSYGRVYHDLLCSTDSPQEALAFIQAHPPIGKQV